jgi:26S proteasome regulatory subunit N3
LQENIDVYTTHEPQQAFHKRISFCLNIHNEAVKACASALNCTAHGAISRTAVRSEQHATVT